MQPQKPAFPASSMFQKPPAHLSYLLPQQPDSCDPFAVVLPCPVVYNRIPETEYVIKHTGLTNGSRKVGNQEYDMSIWRESHAASSHGAIQRTREAPVPVTIQICENGLSPLRSAVTFYSNKGY